MSEAYHRLIKYLFDYSPPSDLQWLVERIRSSRRVIAFGTGRSGYVSEVIVRFLRNLGFDYSYGPYDIPYIFEASDLAIAYSGSGETLYTLDIARAAKRGGAYLVSITGRGESPLSLISDRIVLIPGAAPKGPDYFGSQIAGTSWAPLTPLGTLFELRSLIFSLSLIRMIKGSDFNESFLAIKKGLSDYSPDDKHYPEIYSMIPISKGGCGMNKTVIIGEGMSGIVGKFFATRLRHCSKPGMERIVSFWTDSGTVSVRAGDLVLIISGSGSSISSGLARIAREKGAEVVSITSFPESELARLSSYVVNIPGRVIMSLKGLRSSYYPEDPIYSIFELRTLCFLETLIYYIASRDGITEMDMKSMHSDFT